MFCKNCGKQINDGVTNCPYCGASTGNNAFERMGQFVDSMANSVDQEANRVFGNGNNSFNPNQGYYGRRMLKTNRSLIVYLLLNFITCGIYNFFFIHSMAKDVNEACENDGERTPGVGMFILMTLIGYAVGWFAFGSTMHSFISAAQYAASSGNPQEIINIYVSSPGTIVPLTIVSIIVNAYPLYWRFKLGNKLQRNGQQYGLMIPENGSTIIIWDILGIVCCCFCSWYAIYIIIKNSNTICTAYNNKYVLNQS